MRTAPRLGTWLALSGTLGGLSLAIAARGAAPASPPAYSSVPAQSRLEFIGKQAGADFKGVFKRFTVRVEFDPVQLAASRIEVQVDLDSLDSNDTDRDQTMRSADFFDVKRMPAAHYLTRSIAKSGDGFVGLGALTLHGVTKDVPIRFRFKSAPGGAELDGNAMLERLDFGVGQGDLKSTEWVGDEVRVRFAVALKSTS